MCGFWYTTNGYTKRVFGTTLRTRGWGLVLGLSDRGF